MKCPPELADIITKILHLGLLRIRSLGWSLNGERCAIEADHLHNLTSLLIDFKPELLDYYWRVERVAFMQDSLSEDVASYKPLWEALAGHIAEGSHAGAHP